MLQQGERVGRTTYLFQTLQEVVVHNFPDFGNLIHDAHPKGIKIFIATLATCKFKRLSYAEPFYFNEEARCSFEQEVACAPSRNRTYISGLEVRGSIH